MSRRVFAVLGALVALLFAVPVAVAAAADPPPSPALSDAAKRDEALDVLVAFVPHAESYWRASDLKEPRTGRYDAVGSGVTQPRGAGDIAFAYVTLLAARPDQESFGGVSRETMIDHTIQSIRHEALTNKLSGAGYDRWGGGTWQASLETYLWAFAAHRLWDRLDDDTRALVHRVLAGEADILLTKPIASGEEGDTGAEDNGWNAPTPALAAVMFPDDPNRAGWERAAIKLALNASSTAADRTSGTVVDGRPLSDWMASVNLHPDLTMENHGFFNPIYQQVTHNTIDDAAIFYGEAGHPQPEAFSFRTETIWEQVLGRLATDDGDIALTAGQDWISKDFQHLHYLAILATRFKRDDASVLESRALQLIARRQAAHADGSLLGQAQVGYETMLIKRMADVWWTHHLFGPSPQPTADDFAQARSETAGVKAFPYSDFIAGRLDRAFASMSWDTARPLALLIPSGEADLDDPLFSYYAPRNLLGSASGAVGAHSCACAKDRFSTAGSIGARRFSMTAFPDGTTLLLDRGSGSTFTYSLEDISGVTGERPIWSSAGSGLGALPGSWANAADRLGMIVRGGAGMRASTVAGDNRQIVLTGSTDTGSGDRGAVLLPLVDHDATAALEPYVVQPATPDEWSALAARAADGSVRLAIARWGGVASAPVELSDERGAPVPEQDAELDGTTARFAVGLDAPASRGQTMRFLVRSAAPIRGRQDGEDHAVLRNPGDAPVDVTVTYAPASGDAQTVRRTLAAGEQVDARLVGGELTLAGPELEPLLEARTTLAGLVDRLSAWQRDGHLTTGQAVPLVAATRTSIAAVDDAIRQARAADPDTTRAAAAVTVARHTVDVLDAAAQRMELPTDARDAVTQAADDARAKLDQALDQAYTVETRIEAAGPARPGEPLSVRVTMINRGMSPALAGAVTVTGPDGWTAAGPQSAFAALAPGETQAAELTLTPPADVQPGTTATLHAVLAYRRGNRQRTETADTTVDVAPVVDLAPAAPALPLAPGVSRDVHVRLTNLVDRPLDVTLAAAAPDGATAQPAEQRVTLPASGTADATIAVAGTGRTTGTGTLALTATTGAGARATGEVQVRFSDDLARNGVGAPLPAASASSAQDAFPAALAFDGDASTFWVASGTTAGQGPTPDHPQWLAVDLGGAAPIGSVTMSPRVGYGPKAYTIEVSDDGREWRQVADVPSAANGTVTTSFDPVTARRLRIRITDSWDRTRPPRNVQVVALEVRGA